MSMNFCTIIGDGVGSELNEDLHGTVIIGTSAESAVPFEDALKAIFGVDTVKRSEMSGRVLLQMGKSFFDLEELLSAVKARNVDMGGGVTGVDLIRDFAAWRRLNGASSFN